MPLNVLCEYCYSGLTTVIERFVEVRVGQSHQNSDGVWLWLCLTFLSSPHLPVHPLLLSFMPQILTECSVWVRSRAGHDGMCEDGLCLILDIKEDDLILSVGSK